MSFIFMNTHIEQSTTDPVYLTVYGNKEDSTPIILDVYNYHPYIYVESDIDFENLREYVSKYVKIISLEQEEHKSVYGYSNNLNKLFYKITFSTPNYNQLKTALEKGIYAKNKFYRVKVFEANVGYVLKYMVDNNIIGMGYLKVDDYEEVCIDNDIVYSQENEDGMKDILFKQKVKRYRVDYRNVKSLPLSEYSSIPYMKILSIDIECFGENRTFPNAKINPVIQIGNSFSYHRSKKKTEQVIFCYKSTGDIPGAIVHWYETEREMLIAWKNYLIEKDPDIILGYNIKDFDIPYILERGKVLGIEGFNMWGRDPRPVKTRESYFSSRALGARNSLEIEVYGRVIFDLIQIIRKEHNLRSYSLNAVSVRFLGEQKEDLPYYLIEGLWKEDKETRRRIASYCLRDTYLPLRLFEKLDILVNHVEIVRVMGIPLSYHLTRGSSIKVFSLILKEAKKHNYIIPTLEPKEPDSPFEGAIVMDPLKGFYNTPVAVLDFASLYPSIIIAHNLCYTTLVNREQANSLGLPIKNSMACKCYTGCKCVDSDKFISLTPSGAYFISAGVQKGLLPTILENLIIERKKVKTMMKNTEDKTLYSLLNARQNALKIAANSTYGFTGASVGKLPCLDISKSVTSYGRIMIAKTKEVIERNYSKKQGFSHDSVVVYGDTDSVMINFNESDLKQVFKISSVISEEVSKEFIKPVTLEFEKVYYPYLLMNKKRYAGVIYNSPEKMSRIDTKGIETVRRDNCELVREVIEECLNKLLIKMDIEGAKNYVKNVIKNLYLERIDISKLIISKSLAKEGDKYLAKQAHVELVEKMKKRDQGNIPVLGDRVSYVIVQGDKKTPMYERSEDPIYVLENNIPIDKEYYLEHQLSKPIHRLFEPVMDNVSELFSGNHIKTIRTSTYNGPMAKFLTKSTCCLECRTPGKILCNRCTDKYSKNYLSIQNALNERYSTFSKCWTECQRCQGSVMQEVLCVNQDCPIFFMRTKVKKEILELEEKLEKLKSLEW
ncbi:DNA polymerase delta catalytic subunit [Spraguea lophii 42_110]|uniref:DNA polymerase n=1 Tax=Spraguea lophii (strain 42_110) TaxID=1358809 RepID=S7WC23_SPRLO|nr:DNA polymerase delta catalytic subunit [Spraguea lophii 42_110]